MKIILRFVEVTTSIHHPRRGGAGREVKLPRHEVLLDGMKIGEVERAMMTRETRTAGRVYVNSRWESPGWEYRSVGRFGSTECYSRIDGVERLLREQGYRWPEDERLAKTARVER